MLDANPDTKICLDVGHANCFAAYSPIEFLNRYWKNIAHFHLHDNNGSEDSHSAIGSGNIDFEAIFALLQNFPDAQKVFELEREDFEKSKNLITEFVR